MKPEPLEVERLIRDDQRHSVSVADHQQWREDLAAQQANQQAAEIDNTLADPIHDHAPAYRSSKATSRLLDLLGSLEGREG